MLVQLGADKLISIHAPLTGSDPPWFQNNTTQIISIHAPLTGSDYIHKYSRVPEHYFNPRSPHRERQASNRRADCTYLFQSTLPSQGATLTFTPLFLNPNISIHAPLTGSDNDDKASREEFQHFNPRSPHRERQGRRLDYGGSYDFNPRSPHRERQKRGSNHNEIIDFNPRSPHRERQQIYT